MSEPINQKIPTAKSYPDGRSCHCDQDREVLDVDLLSPLELRGLTLPNRIGMSPMCQYSAYNGLANDWHMVHLGSRAAGGCGLIFVEATAVMAQGRITPGDMGLWTDEHIAPLAKIAAFIHSLGSTPAIQLAHAGRKASCDVPWKGGARLHAAEGGWETIAPSALPFNENDPYPQALSSEGIAEIIKAFASAARRALQAGFKIIEIHAAHGYLLHEFLSPLSNNRTDSYGGSLENRMRMLLQIAESLRSLIPDEMPLFVRISASDWVENGWDLEQSIQLAQALKNNGVDLIDVSSGGLVPTAMIPVAKSYQVPFAQAIRHQGHIKTAAVGLITEIEQASDIITNGQADLILLGRELLRDPYWALKAEAKLGDAPRWPTPYGYAIKRRAK
jgi:2,4-dienoyl-CoA reductase-like NADH-dependent reductase (Old Yellow Enzyme family)